MIHNDAEKLAQQCWDKTSSTPYSACAIEHQLRLCTVVTSIEEQLTSAEPLAGVEGLQDFEAEVLKALTAPPTAPKQLSAAKLEKEK